MQPTFHPDSRQENLVVFQAALADRYPWLQRSARRAFSAKRRGHWPEKKPRAVSQDDTFVKLLNTLDGINTQSRNRYIEFRVPGESSGADFEVNAETNDSSKVSRV